MIERDQIIHDLTIALVSATANKHTPEEYVSLYKSISTNVKKAYNIENPTGKAQVVSKKDLGF